MDFGSIDCIDPLGGGGGDPLGGGGGDPLGGGGGDPLGGGGGDPLGGGGDGEEVTGDSVLDVFGVDSVQLTEFPEEGSLDFD